MGKPFVAGTPQWAPTPPLAPIEYIPVVWPKPKIKVRGYCLAERPEGCWGHYVPSGDKGRTICCVGRENGCVYCGPWSSLRWQGYIPILDGDLGRVTIAQLTKEAAARCPALHDPRRNLRGCLLTLERVGKKGNGMVQAEILDVNPKPRLPPCPDTKAQLHRLWGLVPIMYPLVELIEGKKIEEGQTHA
jgi:hypothetical protein